MGGLAEDIRDRAMDFGKARDEEPGQCEPAGEDAAEARWATPTKSSERMDEIPGCLIILP